MSVWEINALVQTIVRAPAYTGKKYTGVTDQFLYEECGKIHSNFGHIFRKDPVTLSVLGHILETVPAVGADVNTMFERVDMAIAAYKVGRVVCIDDVEYPAPPCIVSVRRSNICGYIALLRDNPAARDELGEYVGGFLRDYAAAVSAGDPMRAPISSQEGDDFVNVVGTPAGLIAAALRTHYEKKYGGVYVIPGFGPECEQFCRGMWPGLDGAFYSAVKN